MLELERLRSPFFTLRESVRKWSDVHVLRHIRQDPKNFYKWYKGSLTLVIPTQDLKLRQFIDDYLHVVAAKYQARINVELRPIPYWRQLSEKKVILVKFVADGRADEEAISHFFDALEDTRFHNDQRPGFDYMTLSVNDVDSVCTKYDQLLTRISKRKFDYEGVTEEVFVSLDKSWRVVKLVDRDAYDHEGAVMRHCVASFHEVKDTDVYSVRQGPKSLITVAITKGPFGTHVSEIKGFANATVDKHWRSFFNDMTHSKHSAKVTILPRDPDRGINLHYHGVRDEMQFNEVAAPQMLRDIQAVGRILRQGPRNMEAPFVHAHQMMEGQLVYEPRLGYMTLVQTKTRPGRRLWKLFSAFDLSYKTTMEWLGQHGSMTSYPTSLESKSAFVLSFSMAPNRAALQHMAMDELSKEYEKYLDTRETLVFRKKFDIDVGMPIEVSTSPKVERLLRVYVQAPVDTTPEVNLFMGGIVKRLSGGVDVPPRLVYDYLAMPGEANYKFETDCTKLVRVIKDNTIPTLEAIAKRHDPTPIRPKLSRWTA